MGRLVAELLELAERVGVRVRVEDLQGGEVPRPGGHCRFRGERVVLLDRRSDPAE